MEFGDWRRLVHFFFLLSHKHKKLKKPDKISSQKATKAEVTEWKSSRPRTHAGSPIVRELARPRSYKPGSGGGVERVGPVWAQLVKAEVHDEPPEAAD